MDFKAFRYRSWVGGQAVDKKIGQDNSFANSQSADFRKSPSQLSVLPRTRKCDNNTVTDLVQNMVMTEQGKIYSVGSSGNIYVINTDKSWSLLGNIGQSGTFGINYRQDQNTIYIAGTTNVSSITNVSVNSDLNVGFYGQSQSTYNNSANAGFNVNSDQQTDSSGAQNILINTSYKEPESKEKRFWQTDIQPVVKIGVFIETKGTGDWTMVVHDGLGNELGTDTITTANLRNNDWNYFEFSQIQVNVGPNASQTYHFHLTSTVADGYIRGTINNDMSSCDMELYADRLVQTSNGLHPMETFQQFLCIGNGRYLSVYEDLGESSPSNSAWQRQKLTFPPGYEVCGLATFNEYLVIATERVTTGNDTPQDGIIFYWDGLSDTYNYFTPIPEGSPEGITVYENSLHYIASGDKYVITSVASTPQKYRKMPNAEGIYTSNNAQTQVYPYTQSVRNGVLLSAWPSITSNQDLNYGVYSWGRVDYTQPYSFGYSYILSSGSQNKTDTNDLTIGMVKNFGSFLYISWRDDTQSPAYGVDVVDDDSQPAEYSYFESLIEDLDLVTKQKMASYVEAKWLTPQDGVEFVLKYRIDRGSWIESPRYSNSNIYEPDGIPTYARLDVSTDSVPARYYEIEYGVDIYCDDTVTETPILVGVSLITSPLSRELLQ